MLFNYLDPVTKDDWTVKSYEGRNFIIVQKITPEYKNGDRIKKTFKVEDSKGEYAYKCMKTKIKADKGADGLLSFMQKCKDKDFGLAWVRTILNYAWDSMREYDPHI